MTLYSDPPSARSFGDDKPTLLVCWWCTLFAGTIILFRVCGRYVRSEKLFREDWIAMAVLIPLYCRMALVHVVLLYGTNNTVVDGMSDHEIWKRSVGSRLVLASRVLYAATLWTLKLAITEFFKRLIPLHLWKPSYEKTFQLIRYFLIVTFIATIIADLAECQPFSHYWAVTPTTPPQCRQGFAQLLTMGISNVITDLLLVLFPIPIILVSTSMTLKRKFQLTCLFGLSIFPVVITLYRMPNIISRRGSQQYRSLWASIEILFATAVANALVLGSFVRDRGVKKLKYKLGSFTDSMDRASSRRGTVTRQWGSDEDLVRDLGLSVDPELREIEEEPAVRLAPMANGAMAYGGRHGHSNSHGTINQVWRFPSRSDAESDSLDSIGKPTDHAPRSPKDLNSTYNTPRKVSFFDVGGLLDLPESETSGGRRYSNVSNDQYWRDHQHETGPPSVRRGSTALLQDIGGLLSPVTSGSMHRTISSPADSPRPMRKMGLADILREERSTSKERKESSNGSRERQRKEDRQGSGGSRWLRAGRKNSSAMELQSLPPGSRTEEPKATVGELQDVGGLLR